MALLGYTPIGNGNKAPEGRQAIFLSDLIDPLVAYRWEGETELSNDKLVWA